MAVLDDHMDDNRHHRHHQNQPRPKPLSLKSLRLEQVELELVQGNLDVALPILHALLSKETHRQAASHCGFDIFVIWVLNRCFSQYSRKAAYVRASLDDSDRLEFRLCFHPGALQLYCVTKLYAFPFGSGNSSPIHDPQPESRLLESFNILALLEKVISFQKAGSIGNLLKSVRALIPLCLNDLRPIWDILGRIVFPLCKSPENGILQKSAFDCFGEFLSLKDGPISLISSLHVGESVAEQEVAQCP